MQHIQYCKWYCNLQYNVMLIYTVDLHCFCYMFNSAALHAPQCLTAVRSPRLWYLNVDRYGWGPHETSVLFCSTLLYLVALNVLSNL